jgi:NAD(P)H-hydrate epimerase
MQANDMSLKRITELPHLPKRKAESHKGNYGRVLVIAGSPGMTGAAYLTGKAALRSGSGLVTVACPESLNPILEIKLTCVMTMPAAETADHTFALDSLDVLLEYAQQCDAVALGPGLSQHEETCRLVRALVEQIEKPLVIDADGLNSLNGATDVLKKRRAATVLTPHPGEMARLANIGTDEVQKAREKTATTFAREHKVVVVLKGHNTIVTDDKHVYVNKTGNPGMACGGTGDVLTGMVASFLGRGFGPFEAAQLAVYLHGIAGDIAASEVGQEALTATDMLAALPYAFMKLPGQELKEWPGFIPGG